MSLFIITVAIIAISVFLMSFNIIFRKNGKFPDSEIGHNKEMRKLGLMCAKSEEKILWRKRDQKESCASCCCSCED
ncbi:MAG: hypothetical protein Q8S04_11915 [Bacteroidales bacterium]|nr:hypothetical protein [Bacteroidales bacterium]